MSKRSNHDGRAEHRERKHSLKASKKNLLKSTHKVLLGQTVPANSIFIKTEKEWHLNHGSTAGGSFVEFAYYEVYQ